MSATESRTGSLGTWPTALARGHGCDRASASDSRVPVTRSGSALEAVRQWPERTAIALHTFTSCKDESTELARIPGTRKSDPSSLHRPPRGRSAITYGTSCTGKAGPRRRKLI